MVIAVSAFFLTDSSIVRVILAVAVVGVTFLLFYLKRIKVVTRSLLKPDIKTGYYSSTNNSVNGGNRWNIN